MSILKKISLMALLSIFVYSIPAMAQIINGRVLSVDAQTRKVSISSLDPATGKESRTDVWMNADSDSGILSELQPNQSVWVEAESDSEGNLRASKIVKA